MVFRVMWLIVDVFGCWKYLHRAGWCGVVRWCGGVVVGVAVVGGWLAVHCGVVRCRSELRGVRCVVWCGAVRGAVRGVVRCARCGVWCGVVCGAVWRAVCGARCAVFCVVWSSVPRGVVRCVLSDVRDVRCSVVLCGAVWSGAVLS